MANSIVSIVLHRLPSCARHDPGLPLSGASQAGRRLPRRGTCSCCSGSDSMSLKAAVKPWLRPLPQWAAVGILPPQEAISVSLEWAGHTRDATQNHTIASLKPLAVAVGLFRAENPG